MNKESFLIEFERLCLKYGVVIEAEDGGSVFVATHDEADAEAWGGMFKFQDYMDDLRKHTDYDI